MKGRCEDMAKESKKRRIVNPWTEREIRSLMGLYEQGKSRNDIASVLRRSSGSVANKIRLLIASKNIKARRIYGVNYAKHRN